ncbi:MAG: STAS domain-containing protein [Desulfobulbus sp.]|jgi:anti-sigma B factor antagonist|uniref:STAS domain-containing protein n=1 Tax=Desulfobulbus sp. TaxID=895 RepID=UPI002840E1F0|nr:STAS domain-containing protein [Desulfobulbus sp.]MDR2550507.1 STAS domain-containing protein [Desulfobulbus sp.]
MNIRTHQENDALHLALDGRLDTTTAPQLDETIRALAASSNLILDFAQLSYLSSAGLRVLLSAQKRAMSSGGSLRIRNANESILELFELTGFSDFLTLE